MEPFKLQRYLDPAKTKTVAAPLQLPTDNAHQSADSRNWVLPEDVSVRLSTISGSWIRDNARQAAGCARGFMTPST